VSPDRIYPPPLRLIPRCFRTNTGNLSPLYRPGRTHFLDEAYLDVTENKTGIPYAADLAREILKQIREETGLTASAGVSFNKFLAKVASDIHKPNGLTVVTPKNADLFIDRLPIRKFYGVGKVTEQKMLEMGIRTGADLKKISRE
jgi:DNA polymerase-4